MLQCGSGNEQTSCAAVILSFSFVAGNNIPSAFVQSHTDCKGHQAASKVDKLPEQKCAEQAEATATPDVPQHVSTVAQPTLLHVARTNEL